MFLAGPVSQGDNHDTKIAPFQIYVLKLINDPEGKVSLKIRDPTGPTFPAGMMAGLQTQLISTLSHKTGVNGEAESWKCEAEICERRVQRAWTQRYESHCCCKGCASRLYSTDGGTRRKFLSPFLHYSFFGELYHMPSP